MGLYIVNRLELWPPDYIKEGGVPRGEGERNTTLYNQSNARLTPTGRRVITRSTIEGPNQDKSTVSCVHRRVPHTLKPEQNCPGDPRGRLSVVKHQQLARQVGAFGEFASESLTDLVIKINLLGTAWLLLRDDNHNSPTR